MNQWLVVAAAVVVFVLAAVIEARNSAPTTPLAGLRVGRLNCSASLTRAHEAQQDIFSPMGLRKGELLKRDWIRQPPRS